MLWVLEQIATGVFRCKGGFTFCPKQCPLEPAQLFKMAERAKIREYKERILNVEHADFNRWNGPRNVTWSSRWAEKLSQKQNLQLSVVSGWLRCRLSFALLRTTLLCVRATRRKKIVSDNNIELAVSAARMDSLTKIGRPLRPVEMARSLRPISIPYFSFSFYKPDLPLVPPTKAVCFSAYAFSQCL